MILFPSYILQSADCGFDKKDVVAANIFDLPLNYCPTPPITNDELWVYAVSFSGELDPSKPDTPPTGSYVFGATVSK